jgi:uncharacterized OsmC-like protein
MTVQQIDAQDRIRTAFERNQKALSLKPAIGRGTAVTRVRVKEGLTCEAEDGPWKLTVDMSPKHGGDSTGPNPGVLGRAALGSCLAMSYARWAAVLGVSLSRLEVEIQADYDARGEYGIDDVRPGYQEVRYVVRIESDAPGEEIQRVVDACEAHTPYLDVFRHPQQVRRIVQIEKPRS